MTPDRTRSETAQGTNSAKQTKQWGLIGVLSVVLLGALMMPTAEPEENDTGDTAGAAGPSIAASSLAEPEPTPSEAESEPELNEEILQVRQLPRLEFDRIVAANPMAEAALASEIAAAEAESREPPPEEKPDEQEGPEPEPAAERPPMPPQPEPSPLRVQAVYGNGREATALVEEKIVRPGQPLADGRKVLEVSNQGVRVGGTPRPGPLTEAAPPAGVEIYDFTSD